MFGVYNVDSVKRLFFSGNPIRNTDTVKSGGYNALGTGSADAGSNGTNETHYINIRHTTRIRQTGLATAADIYFHSKPAALTNFYIEIWRKRGTVYDLVVSQDVLSQIASGAGVKTVTFSPALDVQEGDYVGFAYKSSSKPSAFLKRTDIAGTQLYAVNDAAPDAVGYDWASKDAKTYILPIQIYSQAPLVVGIGNSHISGNGVGHRSYIEATDNNNRLDTITSQLCSKKYFNCTYQNMGISGQTLAQVYARITADMVDLKPKVLLLNSPIVDYTNDKAGYRTDYMTRMTAIFDLCVTNNINFILLTPIMGESLDTDGSTEMDSLTEALKTLVASYPANGRVIDTRQILGKFRAGGTEGNLWDLKTEYNSALDTDHLNLDGNMVLISYIKNNAF